MLLNWPVVHNTVVLEQEVPPVSCWTETCPQGSEVYLADPVATKITQTTGLERREAAPENHITAKNFILIWLQKKQDEGSAMWSELKASAS